MPTTKKFSDLSADARRDPARRARIDAARARALAEVSQYRLVELRKALGLTQLELAEMIGKSQSAVSQIESGEIALSLEVLRSIVSHLGGTLEISAVFDDHRVLLDA